MPTIYVFFDLAEEISSIGEKLIPNWFAFLVQLIALILLVVIIIVFAYKPVKKLLDTRADYIEKEVKDAEENNRIAKENALKSEQLITDSKKTANEIVEAANVRANKEAESIKEATTEEVIRMKKAAQAEIEDAKAQSLKDIQREMVDVALCASEEILGREVSKADNEKLARNFIDNLDK